MRSDDTKALGEAEAAIAERGPRGVTSAAARRGGLFAFILVTLCATTYVVPGLYGFRPWAPENGEIPFWNIIGRELLGQEQEMLVAQREVAALQKLASAQSSAVERAAISPESVLPPLNRELKAVFPPYVIHPDDEVEVEVEVESQEAMAAFYHALAMAAIGQPGAIARVGHWGDSVLGNDGVTSALRRRFQSRFGDAGHGFHVLARYNLAYRHQGVRFKGRGAWRKCEIIFKCESDARYGYGGVSAASSGGGTSTWSTAKEGIGRHVSRFELWFARSPKGGKFQIKVDGQVERVVDTFSEVNDDGWETINVPDGEHTFEVRAIGDGIARGYGVVLERDVPGVVWDGLSLIGSFTQRLDYQDQDHISAQIARRDNDLLVFLLGGNDVQRQKMDLYRTMAPYEEEYTRVIRKFRKGKPEASCLIMSVTDHAERVSRGVIKTRKIVPRLVASQRKIALAEGCGFFDTFAAMGGEGAIGRWYRAKPPLAGPDLAHPTSLGHEALASLFYLALMRGYRQYYEQELAGNPLKRPL